MRASKRLEAPVRHSVRNWMGTHELMKREKKTSLRVPLGRTQGPGSFSFSILSQRTTQRPGSKSEPRREKG